MPPPASEPLVDVLDVNGVVVGAVRKNQAREQGLRFRTAHVLVLDAAGRLCLPRSAPSRDRHVGLLGSSAATYVRTGETFEEAARRALREELGLDARPSTVGVLQMEDGPRDQGRRRLRGARGAPGPASCCGGDRARPPACGRRARGRPQMAGELHAHPPFCALVLG